jgi:DNA-binding LytR/AlgR family response regulator
MNPRAIIAEDEPLLRAELRELLIEVWPELDVVASTEDGLQAIRALEQHNPDVLFLDIEMPGVSGLEVAHHASGRCHIVFVTAYDQYAVAAFEQGAVDYVMKPFSAARLATAVGRVKQRLKSTPANLDNLLKQLAERVAKVRPWLRWINASQGASVRLITVNEICYFQSDSKYTRAVTADSVALIRKSLKELREELDPTTFWQVHRSMIVNINEVASVTHDFRGHLVLKLKRRPETLPVSEPYEYLFRQM